MDIKAIRERREKAGPKPFDTILYSGSTITIAYMDASQFLTHAPTDIDQLLGEVTRLEARVGELEAKPKFLSRFSLIDARGPDMETGLGKATTEEHTSRDSGNTS